MKWLAKRRREILADWKTNRAGYMDTVAALIGTGLNLEQACRLVDAT